MYNRPKLKRLLILPPTNDTTEAVTTVSEYLEKSKIRPEEIGVCNIPRVYPSGAALILVEEDKLDRLREVLQKINLREKGNSQSRPFEFRVHNISNVGNTRRCQISYSDQNRNGAFRHTNEQI